MPESGEVIDSKTPDKGKTVLELALSGTAVLTATGGLLFLLGWSYLYEYYQVFGVDLSLLDLPAYTPLVYSVTAAPWVFRISMICATIVFFALLIVQTTPKIKDSVLVTSLQPWVRYAVFFLPAVLLVFIGVMVGFSVSTGGNQARRTFIDTFQLHLTFYSEKLSSVDSKLKKANECGDLRLLAQTKDLVIVFKKPESEIDPKTKSVFLVRRSDLSSVHSLYPPQKGTAPKTCRPE